MLVVAEGSNSGGTVSTFHGWASLSTLPASVVKQRARDVVRLLRMVFGQLEGQATSTKDTSPLSRSSGSVLHSGKKDACSD